MFEQLLMQAGFAESSAALLETVAVLVIAIGGIVSGVAGFMKAGRAKDFAIAAGQASQVYGQKAVEAKDRVKGVVDALYQLTPEEQKKVLDKTIVPMSQITEEVRKGTEQVNKIDDLFPEFQASKIADLPRESFDTRPAVLRSLKK